MCGIAGCADPDASADALQGLGWELTALLHRRGPDGKGVHVAPAHGLVLAHTRLAILDPGSAGAQPMSWSNGRYVITYNGEIYNHLELRAELDGMGFRFRGHSDTETLLAAVSAWGVDATLNRARGMFAFALFDAEESTLVLARDRFGQKPLYYGYLGRKLVFMSDLEAIDAFGARPDIDRHALADYFRTGSVPSPASIYKGIRKVEPGQIVQYRFVQGRWGEPEARRYWSVDECATEGQREPFDGTFTEAIDELEELVSEAVRLRMLSDVPIGTLLSGGVDSTLVTALMQRESPEPVESYTVAFSDKSVDESSAAAAVAEHLGTKHSVMSVGPDDLLSLLPELPAMSGEPFADPSQIPTHLICRYARQSVTVCLAGDGGDELFGGYPWHRSAPAVIRAVSATPSPARSMLRMASDVIADRVDGSIGRRAGTLARILDVGDPRNARFGMTGVWKAGTVPVLWNGSGPPTERETLWPALPEIAQQMMWLDSVTFLPDTVLTKVDRASMAASLEARAPLLDHEVARFAWTLPTAWRIGPRSAGGAPTNKWILRRLLDRYVPRSLVDRPKQGFDLPISAWLRSELKDWAGDLLAHDGLERNGYLDSRAVQKVWSSHSNGHGEHANRLWTVLMFQAWLAHTQTRSPAVRGSSIPGQTTWTTG